MSKIKKIIGENAINVLFQPIVSVKTKTLVGVEALARAADPVSRKAIPPLELFEAAKREGKLVELDRACRKAALAAFAPLHRQNSSLMLFMNFESSIFDMGTAGSGHLSRSVEEHDIDPRNVVIEIVESKVSDIGSMRYFIESHREQGFLIALDDVGEGHSNLNRIPLVRPDIIKIDKSLIRDIDKEYYNRKIVEALGVIARGTGSLLLAEGIETENEAVTSYDVGADLFQGFFFSVPVPAENVFSDFSLSIEQIAKKHRNRAMASVSARRTDEKKFSTGLDSLVDALRVSPVEKAPDILKKFLSSLPSCECLYLLDQSGRQVGPTVCCADRPCVHSSLLFRPAEAGTDHSRKNYFSLMMGLNVPAFTTEPYISLATGTVCRTTSLKFTHDSGSLFILCADFESAN